MTLDDLERKNGSFYEFFNGLWAARHISRANCAEINWDRQGKATYEIFSIERLFRLFRLFKYRFSRFKEPAHEGIKERCPCKSRYFTVLGQSFVKMRMLPITTSTNDELFSRINIDDFERPWTSKIRVFLLIFAIFGCSAHSKNELRRNGWR